MKNLTKYIALLTMVLIFSASSCKKCQDPANEKCENYDPCYSKTPFEADFIMEEVVSSQGSYPFGLADTSYITDTIVAHVSSSTRLRCTALGDYDSYHWQIGSDPTIFTTKSFTQYFDYPVNVWVTLIATRKPDTLCFPNDDGIDTVKKRLVAVPRSQSLVFGNYFGSSTQKPDSNYSVNVEVCPSQSEGFRVNGLAKCELTFGCNNGGGVGYRGAFFRNNESSVCQQAGFLFYNKPTNKLTIKYQQFTVNQGQTNYYSGLKQ